MVIQGPPRVNWGNKPRRVNNPKKSKTIQAALESWSKCETLEMRFSPEL